MPKITVSIYKIIKLYRMRIIIKETIHADYVTYATFW